MVQQGMNGDKKQARRYHWHSEDVTSFVDEPHSAIDGPFQGEVVNLTDGRAAPSRKAQLDLLTALGPDGILDEFAALTGSWRLPSPSCRISSCRHTTTSARAMCSLGAFMARSPQLPNAGRSTFPSYC